MTALGNKFLEIVTETIHDGNRALAENRYALDFQVPIIRRDANYHCQIVLLIDNDGDFSTYKLDFSIHDTTINSTEYFRGFSAAIASQLAEGVRQLNKMPLLMRPGLMIGCSKNMKRIWLN